MRARRGRSRGSLGARSTRKAPKQVRAPFGRRLVLERGEKRGIFTTPPIIPKYYFFSRIILEKEKIFTEGARGGCAARRGAGVPRARGGCAARPGRVCRAPDPGPAKVIRWRSRWGCWIANASCLRTCGPGRIRPPSPVRRRLFGRPRSFPQCRLRDAA